MVSLEYTVNNVEQTLTYVFRLVRISACGCSSVSVMLKAPSRLLPSSGLDHEQYPQEVHLATISSRSLEYVNL